MEKCLNCGTPLKGKFCWSCGQTAATHRITPKHFVQHELLHGVWHMDNKILFTLKELFTHPGNAAKDYLAGKRVRYYNVFYLLLIVLGLNLLVLHYWGESKLEASGDGVTVMNFIQGNIKLLIFGIIPFFALNAWVIFRKLRFNYAEHIIIAGFVILGCAILSFCTSLLEWIIIATTWEFLNYLKVLLGIAFLFFPVWVYFSVCRPSITKLGFGWRILCFYLLFFLEILIVVFLFPIFIEGFEGIIDFGFFSYEGK